MMYARRDLPGKPVSWHCCFCFYYPASPKIPKVLKHLPNGLKYPTGWGKSSSAAEIDHRLHVVVIGTNKVPIGTLNCRPTESPCSRHIDSSSKTAMQGMGFGVHVSMVIASYHAWGLKEVRLLVLGPPIVHLMHDSLRNQGCMF